MSTSATLAMSNQMKSNDGTVGDDDKVTPNKRKPLPNKNLMPPLPSTHKASDGPPNTPAAHHTTPRQSAMASAGEQYQLVEVPRGIGDPPLLERADPETEMALLNSRNSPNSRAQAPSPSGRSTIEQAIHRVGQHSRAQKLRELSSTAANLMPGNLPGLDESSDDDRLPSTLERLPPVPAGDPAAEPPGADYPRISLEHSPRMQCSPEIDECLRSGTIQHQKDVAMNAYNGSKHLVKGIDDLQRWYSLPKGQAALDLKGQPADSSGMPRLTQQDSIRSTTRPSTMSADSRAHREVLMEYALNEVHHQQMTIVKCLERIDFWQKVRQVGRKSTDWEVKHNAENESQTQVYESHIKRLKVRKHKLKQDLKDCTATIMEARKQVHKLQHGHHHSMAFLAFRQNSGALTMRSAFAARDAGPDSDEDEDWIDHSMDTCYYKTRETVYCYLIAPEHIDQVTHRKEEMAQKLRMQEGALADEGRSRSNSADSTASGGDEKGGGCFATLKKILPWVIDMVLLVFNLWAVIQFAVDVALVPKGFVQNPKVNIGIEITFLIVFGLDYMLRVYASGHLHPVSSKHMWVPIGYLCHWTGLVDFVSIVPSVIEVGLYASGAQNTPDKCNELVFALTDVDELGMLSNQGLYCEQSQVLGPPIFLQGHDCKCFEGALLTTFKFLRAVRVLRVFRFFRYFQESGAMGRHFGCSKPVIMMCKIAVSMLMLMYIATGLLLMAEPELFFVLNDMVLDYGDLKGCAQLAMQEEYWTNVCVLRSEEVAMDKVTFIDADPTVAGDLDPAVDVTYGGEARSAVEIVGKGASAKVVLELPPDEIRYKKADTPEHCKESDGYEWARFPDASYSNRRHANIDPTQFGCALSNQSPAAARKRLKQTRLDYVTALYFIVIALSTVGFGDISPNTSFGRITMTLMVTCTIFIIPFMAGSFIQYKTQKNKNDKNSIRKGLKKQKCRHCGHEWHHENAICCRSCGTILMNMPSNEGDRDFGGLDKMQSAIIHQSKKQLETLNKPQLIEEVILLQEHNMRLLHPRKASRETDATLIRMAKKDLKQRERSNAPVAGD